MLLAPSPVLPLLLVWVLMLVLVPELLLVLVLVLMLVLLLTLVLDEIDVEPPAALPAKQSSRTIVMGNLMVTSAIAGGLKKKGPGQGPFLFFTGTFPPVADYSALPVTVFIVPFGIAFAALARTVIVDVGADAAAAGC